MNNISIKFLQDSQRKDVNYLPRTMKRTSKSSNLLSSKFPSRVDCFHQQHHFQPFSQRATKHQKGCNSHEKGRNRKIYQNQLENSELQYRSMITNLHKSLMSKKESVKKEHQIQNKKDRSQIIHSRNSPRCNFWKRKTSSNSTSHIKQKQRRNQRDSFIQLIDPQVILEAPQAKKMSLNLKSERVAAKPDNKQQEDLVFKRVKPQSQKRKYWTTAYRPWSPKRNVFQIDELSSTIDNFLQVNL